MTNLTIDASGIVRNNGAIVARINNDGTGRRWLSRCDERGMIQKGDGYHIADVQGVWGQQTLSSTVADLLGL